MNTSLVCLVLALSSSGMPPVAPAPDPAAIFAREEPFGLLDEITDHWEQPHAGRLSFTSGLTAPRRVPSMLRAYRDYVIRAQSPTLQLADGMRDEEPIRRSFPPTFSQPASPTPVTPSTPPYSAPYEEPVLSQPAPTFVQPMPSQPFTTAQPPGVSTWGANGPQPYRLGYSLWGDIGWLPGRSTNLPLDDGKFRVFETNIGLNHTIPTWWSPWLFSLEHQFGYRNWSGPNTVDLPSSVYHLGWDMRFDTPLNSQFAPFAMTLAFNPSINSDFNQQLGRQAINFDGRAIVYWQADPQLLVALGAGFWDRVHDHVVPYAGFVWLPDDRWEFRIMWPQSRIQYYMGNYFGEDLWAYASGEYHIESYQIGTSSVTGGKDQIELEDYRILIGLRKSNPILSGFIEGGWVFGRRAAMRLGPDFHINSGFIGRIGIRF